MTRDEAIAIIRSIGRSCRGPLPPEIRRDVTARLHAGDLEGARDLDSRHRRGCGADFNEIVVAGPWDGQEHPYTCSGCGVEGTYRAPSVGLEAPDSEPLVGRIKVDRSIL